MRRVLRVVGVGFAVAAGGCEPYLDAAARRHCNPTAADYESCVYDRADRERRLSWPTPTVGAARR